eukprot:scaffold132529_cov16-Prasinocladus_malaysianus.AAC.1
MQFDNSSLTTCGCAEQTTAFWDRLKSCGDLFAQMELLVSLQFYSTLMTCHNVIIRNTASLQPACAAQSIQTVSIKCYVQLISTLSSLRFQVLVTQLNSKDQIKSQHEEIAPLICCRVAAVPFVQET